MPLSLSNRDQSSGHLFYNRRLRAATTRHSVRMKHDDRKMTAAMMFAVALVALGIIWCLLLNIWKPQGIAGNSAIIGDRDNGALYARIDGKLRPAQTLVSARLAVGNPATVAWVKPSEIEKYPRGPMVGIPGAPPAMIVNSGAPSAWAVCDTAGSARSGDKTVVTAIAGALSRSGRAAPMSADTAVLATFGGGTYAIWGGKRSQVDPADRAVTSSLGIDPAVTVPVTMSRALFDAMPSTEPLRVPEVPLAGQESRWLKGSPIGTVLQAQTSGGGTQFYVLLADGVQKISSFVADLLRSANSYGAAAPRQVSPDMLVKTPQVSTLPVDYYPHGRMKFIDTVANPTTCVGWEKSPSDPQARVTVYNGRGLPVSAGLDDRIVTLVRDDRDPASVEADKVLMQPGATNFVATTSAVPDARSHESLFWVSTEGVRYGIAGDDKTISALGLNPQRAQQAPWPLLRVWAPGPELSRAAALRERDTIPTGGVVRPLEESTGGASGGQQGPPPPAPGTDASAAGTEG